MTPDDTEVLTPEEQESLRKEMEEDLAYFRKVFREENGKAPNPEQSGGDAVG